MNWSNWADFAAMGGYGLYVWGSFGVAALAIAGEIWLLVQRRARLREQHRAQGASHGWPHETQA